MRRCVVALFALALVTPIVAAFIPTEKHPRYNRNYRYE